MNAAYSRSFDGPGPRDLEAIVSDPHGANVLVEWAKKLGKALRDERLATSQIRALYGEARQIQADWTMGEGQRQLAYRRLVLLKPKMAYRARRERGQAVQHLVSVLQPALDLVVQAPPRADGDEIGLANNQDDNLQRFMEFFEAILAYHKAFGGY